MRPSSAHSLPRLLQICINIQSESSSCGCELVLEGSNRQAGKTPGRRLGSLFKPGNYLLDSKPRRSYNLICSSKYNSRSAYLRCEGSCVGRTRASYWHDSCPSPVRQASCWWCQSPCFNRSATLQPELLDPLRMDSRQSKGQQGAAPAPCKKT